MERLRKTATPQARIGRWLAQLLSFAPSQAEPGEGRLTPPTRRPAAPRATFLRYLNDAWSGGGRR